MQIIQSDGKTAITYLYVPSDVAAYIFIILFGSGTFAQIYQLFRLRAWFFIPFIIGCICSAFGYYGRLWSHKDVDNVRPYVMQYLLILPAPLFFAASIYMSLGRIAKALDATEYLPINARWLTKLFVLFDIICFCVVMAGAGMESTTSAAIAETGGKIGTAGLLLQVFVTCFFAIIVWMFYERLKVYQQTAAVKTEMKWGWIVLSLILACIFIVLRSIVRSAQEIQGFYGFVNSHEVFLYVFDATLMTLMVWMLVFMHPGRVTRLAKQNGKKAARERSISMTYLNRPYEENW